MPLNTEVDYNNVVIQGTVELGVKGERGLQGFKGDQGPPVPVAHELGDDPELAVSQKLLTDSIAEMEQSNEAAVTEATNQAGIATAKANGAAQSAQDASGSALAADQSATAATEQAGIAATKAGEAASSAVDAATQAGLAADSESAAGQAATIATNKAGEASQSAQAAAQSATQAENVLADKVDKAELTSKNPSILIVDQLRAAVEAQSGGRNTVRYTDKGEPCYFYVLPKFNLEDLPGWDSADGTGPHPAFIQNGVEKGYILVGMYQAAEIAGEAVSQPYMAPRVSINYDNSLALSQASGDGFDMMSNWDWSAVAMWCMANGFQPRGNSSYGRSHEKLWETGSLIDPSLPLAEPDAPGKSTLTGSGPNGWRHDNSPHGIADLVGNVWEWQTGFKLVDGVAHIAPDGGVYTEEQYIDTEFSLALANPWSNTSSDGAPSILKQALIVPSSAQSPVGRGYINAEGERLPFRGGYRLDGSAVGLGALALSNGRTAASSTLGFRLTFRE